MAGHRLEVRALGGRSAGVAMILAMVVVFAGPVTADEPDRGSKLSPSAPSIYANFGRSVALDGSTMVVGSTRDDGAAGAAYVFEHQGGGWHLEAKITASDGEAFDLFGRSVAVSGDTIVVGSYRDDDTAEDAGAVFIFRRHGTAWVEEAKLVASDGEAHDEFGTAVGLSGDTMVVGTYSDDDLGIDAGAAYVFSRENGVWREEAKLLASDGAARGHFGSTVAVAGDTIVAGAFGREDPCAASAEAAYVFRDDGNGWAEEQKLTADDGTLDQFGSSVAIAGGTIVVGAVGRDDECPDTAGSAYVFTYEGGTWQRQARLQASDGAPADVFGRVAIEGDTIVVGAIGDDDRGPWSGSAYVFNRLDGRWTQQVKLTAFDGATRDYFGIAVAVSGDAVAVGAPQSVVDGVESGAVYVYSKTAVVAPSSCTIIGTSGNDVIVGTDAADVICGRGGNDVIYGNAGNDWLRGGDGNDRIYGGQGEDTISGNDGDDRLRGGLEVDTIRGGPGDDVLRGRSGNDRLTGNSGNDALYGGKGDDQIFGGSGTDFCHGGLGSNRFVDCE